MSSKEVCPACAHYCGYCGGSGHPSCGCFVRGRACSAHQEDVYHATYKAEIGRGASEQVAEEAAYQAAKTA